MKIENIQRLYELDNDRRLLSNVVNALDKEGDAPYVTLDTLNACDMRLPVRLVFELREMARKQLDEVEREIALL